MFVNTEGVTSSVHFKVFIVNTKGVTFQSVHKQIGTTTEQIKGFVTPAAHPRVGGLRCSQPSEFGNSTCTAAANQTFFERLAIDLGLSVSMSVSLCRSLFISVCLQRSWCVGVHVGLFTVDLCRFRSLCWSRSGCSVDQCPSRSLCLLISVYLSLSLSLSVALY